VVLFSQDFPEPNELNKSSNESKQKVRNNIQPIQPASDLEKFAAGFNLKA
jgi:hypothetical protein